MPQQRLSAAQLRDHLALEPGRAGGVVRALRRVVLATVPDAAEGIRFGALCYFHAAAPFGAIGGNICLIEVRGGGVRLSFIHGASLADPHRLLQGRGKAKRSVPIESREAAADPLIIALVREAAMRSEGAC